MSLYEMGGRERMPSPRSLPASKIKERRESSILEEKEKEKGFLLFF